MTRVGSFFDQGLWGVCKVFTWPSYFFKGLGALSFLCVFGAELWKNNWKVLGV